MVRLARNADRGISLFVIAWLLLFSYESFRVQWLNPLCRRALPKVQFLFPPAGWIMFYAVDASYGFAEVRGVSTEHGTMLRRSIKRAVRLDPHRIFRTQAVGYDNIRRNVLVSVLNAAYAPSFCRYLQWKFPPYDTFVVVEANYPDLIHSPGRVVGRIAYRCDQLEN